jgi:hypothetical protein
MNWLLEVSKASLEEDLSHCCSPSASSGINSIVELGFCGKASNMRVFRSVTARV